MSVRILHTTKRGNNRRVHTHSDRLSKQGRCGCAYTLLALPPALGGFPAVLPVDFRGFRTIFRKSETISLSTDAPPPLAMRGGLPLVTFPALELTTLTVTAWPIAIALPLVSTLLELPAVNSGATAGAWIGTYRTASTCVLLRVSGVMIGDKEPCTAARPVRAGDVPTILLGGPLEFTAACTTASMSTKALSSAGASFRLPEAFRAGL